MTIRDILNSGIEVQGKVIVRKWIEEKNDNKIFCETELAIFPEKVLDKEITHMWAMDNNLIIEIE